MNTKRFFIFLLLGVFTLSVFAFVGRPYSELSIVSAQYGGGGGSDDDEDDGLGGPDFFSGQGVPAFIQLGQAAPAPIPGDGRRRVITGCPLFDAPFGNRIPGPGYAGEAPTVGLSADGLWVLIPTGGNQGAWVEVACAP